MTTADPVLVGFFSFAAGVFLGGALAAYVDVPGRAGSSARVGSAERVAEDDVVREREWDRRVGVVTFFLGAVFFLACLLIVALARK